MRHGIGVPGRGIATEGSVVCGNTTVIAPVVEEGEDELQPVLFGGVDDVIQALDAVFAVVDGAFSIGQKLEVDLIWVGVGGGGELSYVSETPDTSDLVTSL